MSSRRRARRTEFAMFSGYEISREEFIDMVSQMPALRSQLGESYDLEDCDCAYTFWRMKYKAPSIMALFERKLTKGEHMYAAVSSFFLPTRCIDYTDESQLQGADSAPFSQETEKDKALLAYFARCVHDRGGGLSLDTKRFPFRWVKEYHPCYSASTGTWSR